MCEQSRQFLFGKPLDFWAEVNQKIDDLNLAALLAENANLRRENHILRGTLQDISRITKQGGIP